MIDICNSDFRILTIIIIKKEHTLANYIMHSLQMPGHANTFYPNNAQFARPPNPDFFSIRARVAAVTGYRHFCFHRLQIWIPPNHPCLPGYKQPDHVENREKEGPCAVRRPRRRKLYPTLPGTLPAWQRRPSLFGRRGIPNAAGIWNRIRSGLGTGDLERGSLLLPNLALCIIRDPSITA